MIYYNIGDILIRDMTDADPQIITNEEIAQGWIHQKVEKVHIKEKFYNRRWQLFLV